jgi:NNP family nitrate/nitrite transporter-like MFS transporter
MSNLGSILVLAASTWAFIVCFAVWLMFGVIGIPIKNELGLNGVEFGLLTATPVLTGALFRLPLGIWTHRFGGRMVTYRAERQLRGRRRVLARAVSFLPRH